MHVAVQTENGGLIAADSIIEIAVDDSGAVAAKIAVSTATLARPLSHEQWREIPDDRRMPHRGHVPARQLALELYRAIRECEEAENRFLFIAYNREAGAWEILDATEEANKAKNHSAYIETSNAN